VVRVAPVLVAASSAGGETQCVSCSRPKGQSLSPDREEFPGGQAVGLLFQHPVLMIAVNALFIDASSDEAGRGILWMRRVGDGAETTVEQALMRGLATA